MCMQQGQSGYKVHGLTRVPLHCIGEAVDVGRYFRYIHCTVKKTIDPGL